MSRKTIIVIGTGRCGTTVAAKVLLRLGVFLGDRFCQGDAENPEARGEDAEFHEICKLYVNEDNSAKDHLRRLISQRNARFHVWGVKHPNLVFLIDDFVEMATNPVVVSCERDHQEILDSMNHFWSCGVEKANTWFSEAWECQKAFVENPTCPVFRVQFDDYFTDPRGTINRIVDLCELSPTSEQLTAALNVPDVSKRRYWSKKTAKVLYLTSKVRFETKMSRGRAHHMAAVSRHPDVVKFAMWGNGFDGYVESESLTENIKRLGWTPDVIHAYKPEDHIGVAQWDGLKSVAYNEAWWPNNRALKEVQEHGFRLVIHHHENDAPRFAGFDGNLVHIPHCADTNCFVPPQDQVREIDCLMSGVDSKEIYPVRHRLKSLLRQGLLQGEVRPHMGGRKFHSAKSSYRSDGLSQSQAQFQDYANHLQRSKISLCCTSKYKYALEKLVQSAMAGCVIMSDMPNDSVFRNGFGSAILEVNDGMSDNQIVDMAQSVLNNGQEWNQRSFALQAMACRFTMEYYADRYVDAVRNCN
jgi:hypothetical protein